MDKLFTSIWPAPPVALGPVPSHQLMGTPPSDCFIWVAPFLSCMVIPISIQHTTVFKTKRNYSKYLFLIWHFSPSTFLLLHSIAKLLKSFVHVLPLLSFLPFLLALTSGMQHTSQGHHLCRCQWHLTQLLTFSSLKHCLLSSETPFPPLSSPLQWPLLAPPPSYLSRVS